MDRFVQSLIVIISVIVLNFVLMTLAPGDPATYMVGTEAGTDPVYLMYLRERYGFDQPIHIQLMKYLSNVIRGDLGYSFRSGGSTFSVILSRLPATLLLMLPTFILSVILGISLGLVSSVLHGSGVDYIMTGISLIGFSIPTFWLGLILMLYFSLQLGLLPAGGIITYGTHLTGWPHIIDVLRHLLLPSVTLSASFIAVYTRLTRASMLEVLRKDFIITAWGKGLKGWRVYIKHGLRNALLPLVTIMGMNFGYLFAGACVTETIFSWPGIGRLMYESALSRDYPVVSGVFLFVTIMVVLSNFITDLIYSFLDPRIKER